MYCVLHAWLHEFFEAPVGNRTTNPKFGSQLTHPPGPPTTYWSPVTGRGHQSPGHRSKRSKWELEHELPVPKDTASFFQDSCYCRSLPLFFTPHCRPTNTSWDLNATAYDGQRRGAQAPGMNSGLFAKTGSRQYKLDAGAQMATCRLYIILQSHTIVERPHKSKCSAYGYCPELHQSLAVK